MDCLANPYVSGSLQLAGGLSEAGIGVAFGVGTSWTGGGAIVGALVATHGADQALAGFRTILAGAHQSSFTSLSIQSCGVSAATSDLLDGGISIVGTGVIGVASKMAVAAKASAFVERPQTYVPIQAAANTAPSLDALSQAAGAADRGGLTAAGRSLTKHGAGARAGNTLSPAAKGSPATINQTAQNVVDDILTTPGSALRNSSRGRFGLTIEVTAPDGRGMVYDVNGKFLFFKE